MEQLSGLLRVVLLWLAIFVAAIATIDWLVRTRRLGPFSLPARLMRRYVDPLIAPIERRVVRAGGLPANAPWWVLATVVIGGVLQLAAVDFVREMLGSLALGVSSGPMGLVRLVVSWSIALFQIALLVRVISSWLPVSHFAAPVRWSYMLTEPVLRPLRRIVPLIGPVDITPIIAFFLSSIVRALLLNLLT
jgi:YggT family protein